MEQLLLPALLFVATWFLLIRPQQARVRRQRQLMASLAVGDEVLTAGGLIGTIRVLTDHEARLEVGPGVEVRVARAAVSSTLRRAEAVDAPEPESPETT